MITEQWASDHIKTAVEDSGLFEQGCVVINRRGEVLDQTGALELAPFAVIETADSTVVERQSMRLTRRIDLPLTVFQRFTGDQSLDDYMTLRDSLLETLALKAKVLAVRTGTDIFPVYRVTTTAPRRSEFFAQTFTITIQG